MLILERTFQNLNTARKTCKPLTVAATRKYCFSMPVRLPYMSIYGGPQPGWSTEFPYCLQFWPYMVRYANKDAGKCTFLSIKTPL